MSSLASQRPMHMAETVMLDVAAPNEVVVDSKIDKDPRVDEETLEDRTVAVEVLQLLEEVGARVKPQTHEPRDLFPRSPKTSTASLMFSIPRLRRCTIHTLDHGFFFFTRPKTLLYSTCYLRLPFFQQHAFSSLIFPLRLYCDFPFRQKEKFSGMISMDEWIDLIVLGIRAGVMFQAC